MSKLERVSNPHPESPFYVAKVTNATLSHGPLGPNLQILLNRKNFFDAGILDVNSRSVDTWTISLTGGRNPHAAFVQDALGKFQKGENTVLADKDHPIRWLGAGGLLLLSNGSETFAVINKRVGSFIWDGYYSDNGGLSSSIDELLSPTKLASRELNQELMINGRSIEHFSPVEVYFPNSCHVTISFKGQDFHETDLILVVDPKTGTIDFRKIFTLHFTDISALTLSDNETLHSKDHKEIPLHRPIFLVPLRELLKIMGSKSKAVPAIGFIDGDKIPHGELGTFKIAENLLTPSLRAILETIKDDINFSRLV